MNKSQRKKLRKVASNRERQRRADAEAIKRRRPREIRGRDRLREVARRVLRKPRTVRCVARPNRSKARKFTPEQVGRLVCLLLRQGDRMEHVRRELERCAPCETHDRTQSATGSAHGLAVAIEEMANNMFETLKVLAVGIAIVGGLIVFVRAFGLLLPRLLPLALVQGVPLALTRLTTLQRTFINQQAANAQRYEIFRRQAANADVYRKINAAGL